MHDCVLTTLRLCNICGVSFAGYEVLNLHVVLHQGEEGRYFYVVSEGHFDVIVNTGTGPMVLCTYTAGDHANSAFGELALATGRPQAAEIVARTEGRCCIQPYLS